jgi:hypothetical protein
MLVAFHQAVPTVVEAGGGFAVIAVIGLAIASLFSKN